MNRRGAMAIAVVVLLLGASAGAQRQIDLRMSSLPSSPDMLWVPSGKILRRLSLGHEGLLADVYWTRVVQYYGGRIRDHNSDFSLLGQLLNITVDLDPRLLIAYKFGAIFLAQPSPRGAGDPHAAVALIKKGIAANPEDWRLWHDMGFIYYMDLKDYSSATAAYLEGSKNPKAAPWMKVMAATIQQRGGNRDTSRFLWTEVLRSTEDPNIRENAADHLNALRAEEDIENLEKLTAAFHQRTGQWPGSFNELIAQGYLSGIPADPTNIAYQLSANGKVTLQTKSKIKLQ